MKDEIKEILEALKVDEKELRLKSSVYPLELTPKEQQALLDYITSLQERIKELEKISEEHRKINGELREENKRLKELCDKYEEEHNTAFKLWIQQMKEIPTYEEKKDLKYRINKAIEYIESTRYKEKLTVGGLSPYEVDCLLEKLKGE